MSSQTSKKNLIAMCKLLGIKINTSKTKEQLKNLIKNYETSKKVSIVSADDTVIKYVYHLADIHIRSLERHIEYIQVFENLYCYLKSQENLNESILVIAGDIFHSKDKLVPESIAVFNGLVTNLTSILPVCMIAGNHDAFASSNRVDVISGITDIKKFDNLHFFKNSGIYKYNNINFVVSSVIDDTFTDAPELSNEYRNIGLYHGIVSNSKTDSGTSLTSNVNAADFKNLDIVMLGDIHKRQFLTPTIAYCGSLVQQNHGENLTEHGLIKWNILDKTNECVNIKNDYGYVTISPDFSEDTFFPKNSRVRVRHPYDYDLNIEKVKERLAKHTTVLSVSKEILQDYSVQQVNVEEEERCEDSLLSSLLLTKFDTDTRQKILDLHSNYKQEYSGETKLEVLPWKINYVEFKNIFIYGGDVLNRINLDSGITGIIGKNASGKTSFLNIIIYALFGNVFKTKNFSNRNIINRNSKNFYLKMSIGLAGEELVIEKQGKIKSRGIFTGMDETLTFSKKTVEGEIVQLNAGNKLETMKKIFDTLGLTTKENFILTNVVSYANYVSLLNHSSADITKTFAQLFDILVYKNIHSDVLKKHKRLSTVVSSNIEKMKKLKEHSVASSVTVVNRVSEETVREANNALEATNVELESVLLKTVDLEDFDEKLILKEQDYVKIVQEFDKSNPFADFEITFLQKQKKVCSKPKSIVAYAQEVVTGLEEELKQIYIIPEEPCTREIYINLTNNQIDFVAELDKLLLGEDDTVSLSKALFLGIKKHFENPKNTLLSLEYEQYLKDLKIYNDKIEKRKKNIVLLNDQYCAKNKSIDEAVVYRDAQKKLEKIHLFKKDLLSKKKIMELKELRSKQTSKILSLTKMLAQTKMLDESVKKSEEELSILQSENDTIQAEITTLSYYKDILLLLPKMILTDKIKKIEMECNILCYRLIGLTINLDTYAEADSPETKYEITAKKASGSIIGIDQISGFERFVVNVALKLALDKYKCQSGAKIFCIDEAFDCISAENFDKIDELFEYLKQYYQTVLVVSHNDELKKKIDKSININVGDTFSSIAST